MDVDVAEDCAAPVVPEPEEVPTVAELVPEPERPPEKNPAVVLLDDADDPFALEQPTTNSNTRAALRMVPSGVIGIPSGDSSEGP